MDNGGFDFAEQTYKPERPQQIFVKPHCACIYPVFKQILRKCTVAAKETRVKLKAISIKFARQPADDSGNSRTVDSSAAQYVKHRKGHSAYPNNHLRRASESHAITLRRRL